MKLNTVLRALPLMVQITRYEELKDLHQIGAHAQEHQQKHRAQLDEFQEVGGQLVVKAIATLQVLQESQKMVNNKFGTAHPVQQDVLNCQSAANKVQLQVHEIAQQFE